MAQSAAQEIIKAERERWKWPGLQGKRENDVGRERERELSCVISSIMAQSAAQEIIKAERERDGSGQDCKVRERERERGREREREREIEREI